MTRLRHSQAGFLRLLQMGSAHVAVLVEGRVDRLFFDQLVSHELAARPALTALIRTAREVMAGAGGKKALLSYYDYLRRRSALVTELGGKKTSILICLDKDLDDLTGTRRRSRHVIYTEHFDVESYLFLHGDLVSATSAATTLDRVTIDSVLAPAVTWTRRVSMRWREWVAICVFEITNKCSSGGNYGVCPSPVHTPGGDLDGVRFGDRMAALQQESGCPGPEFAARWDRVVRRVDRLFARGKGDIVFKGKWYAWLLVVYVAGAVASRDVDLSKVRDELPKYLIQTLDFDLPWTTVLRGRLLEVLDSEF